MRKNLFIDTTVNKIVRKWTRPLSMCAQYVSGSMTSSFPDVNLSQTSSSRQETLRHTFQLWIKEVDYVTKINRTNRLGPINESKESVRSFENSNSEYEVWASLFSHFCDACGDGSFVSRVSSPDEWWWVRVMGDGWVPIRHWSQICWKDIKSIG